MSSSEQHGAPSRAAGLDLAQLVRDLGASIQRIDARRPQAANMRTGEKYQPGIGPHPETQAVELMAAE